MAVWRSSPRRARRALSGLEALRRVATTVLLSTAVFVVPLRAEEARRSPRYVSPPVTPLRVTVDMNSLEVPESVVREMVTVKEGEPLDARRPPKRTPAPDGTVQLEESPYSLDVSPPGLLSAPDVNVAGVTSAANPPDTVGDVGPNHFVQMVNATLFRIWNKQGIPLTGALDFGALWPAGHRCADNLGDPIVVYDHLADRWLLSQFANPGHMCVAISQTPNPVAGTWFLYTFNTLAFPDYPKFGVWPDGYYMSSYEGRSLGVYAFDRSNMVLGNAAAFVKTTVDALGAPGVRDTRILPSDLDGPAPPDGTPNFFLRPVDHQQDPGNPTDRIEVYEFRVSWLGPSFTFTLVNTLLPAAFDIMTCNRNGGGLRDCIPQPDTADTVDALSNRPMMQLKYRRLGSTHAIVVNQTIDVAGTIPSSLGFTPANEVAGIRWYELRNSGAGWTIRQQGTYAPQLLGATTEAQLLHRWMGSMAMDKDGNIAVGYSIVNDDDTNEVFPGLRYTGRRFNDALGVLPQGEQVITNGANSQTSGFGGRWGDYSALSVDPQDDCTFWYTSHLAGTGGAGARPTRIASFRFDTCATDLRIAKGAEPDPATAGEQIVYTINVTNQGPLDATHVTVVDVLPSGATYVADSGSCLQAPAGTLTCALGSLPSGSTSSFQVRVLLDSALTAGGPTFVTNTALVRGDQGERDPSDNAVVVRTLVEERADLRVTKLCKPDHPVLAGQKAECTILVDNQGPSLARDVVADDVLVASGPFTVSDVAASQGTCAESAGPPRRITCNLGDIDAGDQAVVTYKLTAARAVDVNNVVSVRSPTPDPDVSNNHAAASVSFIPAADLWMEKKDEVDAHRAGGQTSDHDVKVTYTLTVHNDSGCTVRAPLVCGTGGPSDADDVKVVDQLPLNPETLKVESLSPGCVYYGRRRQVVCQTPLVAAGSFVKFTIELKMSKVREIINEATVSSTTADPDRTNNTHRIKTMLPH